MFCKNCGKELLENVKFCNQCGSPIEERTVDNQEVKIRKKDYFKYHCSEKSKIMIKVMWIVQILSNLFYVGMYGMQIVQYIAILVNVNTLEQQEYAKDVNEIREIVFESIGAILLGLFFMCVWSVLACAKKNRSLSVINFIIQLTLMIYILFQVFTTESVINKAVFVILVPFVCAIIMMFIIFTLNKEYKVKVAEISQINK